MSPISDSHASFAHSVGSPHTGYHRPRKFRYNIPWVYGTINVYEKRNYHIIFESIVSSCIRLLYAIQRISPASNSPLHLFHSYNRAFHRIFDSMCSTCYSLIVSTVHTHRRYCSMSMSVCHSQSNQFHRFPMDNPNNRHRFYPHSNETSMCMMSRR